jgi:hypothetical protein
MYRTLDFETSLPKYAKGAAAKELALLQFSHETGSPNGPSFRYPSFRYQ